MRHILALDLATRTGWCCGPPDGSPRVGTLVLPNTGEDVGRYLAAFEDWLNAMIAASDIAAVAFEAPILTAGKTTVATARKLLGLACATETIAWRRDVRCFEVNISSVKKFLAGHGKAQKADMIGAATMFGFPVKDEHQADAVGVWAYAVNALSPKHAGRFALGRLGQAAGARGASA